ncbi:hypothetical protein NDU88_007016 [Pleurodeles waltl]|uniref:Uncharacterized protein n=1 Tax=Pleurodeles waltl TaxID=8319 RepID=A0AAV7U289_PLEWA|nr:hypothetical protein NDU88_007016 [Pleurodeles waltl]
MGRRPEVLGRATVRQRRVVLCARWRGLSAGAASGWKSSGPPSVHAWKYSFEVWAGAEGVALKREDVLGLRKYPLSDSWEEMLLRLQNMSGGSAVEESV